MPGEEAAYTEQEGGVDLWPQSSEVYNDLKTWCVQAFDAAESARRPFYDKWKRFYRLYRMHTGQRKKGDWRSKLQIPYTFSMIETITPKMLAQPPKFVTMPVGGEDVFPAKSLERLMDQAATADWNGTSLYLEVLKMGKQALKYGTGILKTYYDYDVRTRRMKKAVPMQAEGPPEPVRDALGTVQTDMAGNPTMAPSTEEVYTEQWVDERYVAHEGPVAKFVDIFHFFVAPEAEDIQDARYVIQRTYRDVAYIEQKVKEGVYHLPEGVTPTDITVLEEGSKVRKELIDMQGSTMDQNRRPVELLEIWTDDGRLITMANRTTLLRVQRNPFTHGQKPYVKCVDYLLEGEFWGMGEIEATEGIQDAQNALWNGRIDALKLALMPVFAGVVDALEDRRDLTVRPYGFIRVAGDRVINEVLQKIDLGDVPRSAFAEVEAIERLHERVTGVTPFQTGLDTPSYSNTATGVGLIQEAGNTKFAMKLIMVEQMALRVLARHWGTLIQQFMDTPQFVRYLGPTGEWAHDLITPEGIMGNIDFDIESSSTSQTETVRREQAIALLREVAAVAPQAVPQLLIDLLEAFGKKDLASYLGPQAQMYALQQFQLQQALNPGSPGAGVPPDQMGQQQGQGQQQGAQVIPIQPPQPIMPQERIDATRI